jgi:hypothetical protein
MSRDRDRIEGNVTFHPYPPMLRGIMTMLVNLM